jgi:hypothetical protein
VVEEGAHADNPAGQGLSLLHDPLPQSLQLPYPRAGLCEYCNPGRLKKQQLSRTFLGL